LTPANKDHFEQIGAAPFFSGDLTGALRKAVNENAMTPAVAASSARQVRDDRQAFIQTLERLRDGLAGVGIEPDDLNDGEADISFLIPRELFDNQLNGLSKEFAVIDRIVRIFSEAATGRPEQATLKSLSTTDPVVTLGVTIATIAMIGRSITWLLETWKKTLEIRELRNKSKEIGLTDKELKVFDDKIKGLVDKAVADRVSQVLTVSELDSARKNELAKGLDWSLRSLLSRIERGMSVEIRMIPRYPSDPDEGDGEGTESAHYSDIEEITNELVFPKPSGEPVLALPGAPPSIDDAPGAGT
jgi:hypothetical protein